MKKRKQPKVLILNSLTVEVHERNKVLIHQKMDDVSDMEAQKICTYLYQEGFLTNGEEVLCSIIND